MLRSPLQTLTFFLSFLLNATPAQLFAADLAKEIRMKNQVIDYIMDGDAVLLQDGDHEFLSIYMQPDTQDAKEYRKRLLYLAFSFTNYDYSC